MITQADLNIIGANLKPIIKQMIEEAWTRPLQVFTVANQPAANDPKWLRRPYVVSDGAGSKWVAISNGTTRRYLEGTAS